MKTTLGTAGEVGSIKKRPGNASTGPGSIKPPLGMAAEAGSIPTPPRECRHIPHGRNPGEEHKTKPGFSLHPKLPNPFIAQRKEKIPTKAAPASPATAAGISNQAIPPSCAAFLGMPGPAHPLGIPGRIPNSLPESPRGVSCSQLHPKQCRRQTGISRNLGKTTLPQDPPPPLSPFVF